MEKTYSRQQEDQVSMMGAGLGSSWAQLFRASCFIEANVGDKVHSGHPLLHHLPCWELAGEKIKNNSCQIFQEKMKNREMNGGILAVAAQPQRQPASGLLGIFTGVVR